MRRELALWDGCVNAFDGTGAPSRLRLMRGAAAMFMAEKASHFEGRGIGTPMAREQKVCLMERGQSSPRITPSQASGLCHETHGGSSSSGSPISIRQRERGVRCGGLALRRLVKLFVAARACELLT